MLNTIAGLSKRIIELFDALDKFASEEYREKADEMREDVEAPSAARSVLGSESTALATDEGGEELAESSFRLSVQGAAHRPQHAIVETERTADRKARRTASSSLLRLLTLRCPP